MKYRNIIDGLVVILTLCLSLSSCQKPILESTPSVAKGLLTTFPEATLKNTDPYPRDTPVDYPAPYSDRSTTVTPSPTGIKPLQATITPSPSDMTPVSASKDLLAAAMSNFEAFFRELPFVNASKERPYKEYYGCVDSKNAGSSFDYKINTQSVENIKTALVEYFDKQNIKHSDWKEFEISGFLGYSWEISAYKYIQNENDALVIIRIDLLEYRLRATSEPFEVPIPTDETGFPLSNIYMWLNYVEKPGQFEGYRKSDLLKTCRDGWWRETNQ